MKKSFLLVLLIFSAVLHAQNYMAQYNEAVKLVEAGKTSEARAILDKVATFPVETGLRDNAAYWIAVSYFDEANYSKAIEYYRKAQILPDYNKAAAAQYELAYAKSLMGDKSGALMEFCKIASMYPNSGLVSKADSAIAEISGGNLAANIPGYGPATPSLPPVKAAVLAKEAAPIAPEPRPDAPLMQSEEPRPDAPLTQTSRPAPVIATEGPLAGAEIPVAQKRAPMPLDETPPPPPQETQPAITEPESSPEPPQTESALPEPGTQPETTAKKSETGVIYDDSAPLDVDPSRLIRPEDKSGWE